MGFLISWISNRIWASFPGHTYSGYSGHIRPMDSHILGTWGGYGRGKAGFSDFVAFYSFGVDNPPWSCRSGKLLEHDRHIMMYGVHGHLAVFNTAHVLETEIAEVLNSNSVAQTCRISSVADAWTISRPMDEETDLSPYASACQAILSKSGTQSSMVLAAAC